MPTFLRRASSGSDRSPTTMTSFGFGYYDSSTSNDYSRNSCQNEEVNSYIGSTTATTDKVTNTKYCPGNGQQYTAPTGVTLNTISAIQKSPGQGCTADTSYSNGGAECKTCSEAKSDRSYCHDGDNSGVTSQFAEAFINSFAEREGVEIKCLTHTKPVVENLADPTEVQWGVKGTTSGTAGTKCDIEGSRQTSIIDSKWYTMGTGKAQHSTAFYRYCSWCPENLNCEYQHNYFVHFRGYLLLCPHGEYSPNGDFDCHRKDHDVWCKAGYYKAILTSVKDDPWVHEQDKGFECIPFNTSPTSGYEALDSTYVPECPIGDFLRYGIEGCSASSPGFYTDSGSLDDTATKCADGYVCTTSRVKDELKTTQFSCPKGSVSMTSGARSEMLQCDLCRSGKYCDEGSTLSSAKDCEKGYFCPSGTGDKLQFSCGAGFYGSTVAKGIFEEACAACSTAKYCEPSSTAETNCPLGYICPMYTDDKNKYPVMPGKYVGTATGALSGATACSQGKYCPLGSSAEQNCPVGTFTAETGMGELMNCGDCPAGKACPTAGLSSVAVNCAKGHYCPPGTRNPTDFECPPGTFSDSTDNKASSDCTDCTAGKACRTMTTTTAQTEGSKTTNAILDCAAGHYCPVRTESATQYPCPAGTFTTSTSLTQASECTDCPAGKWCDHGSPNSNTDCPKNFYCPLKTTSPLPCAAGKYSAAGASTCPDCTLGHICPEGSQENPQVCPAGYFMDSTGSAGPCDPAPEGYYSTGSGAKIACADKKWSAPGGKTIGAWVDCPVGYYCVGGKKHACGWDTSDANCAAGKWCAAGSSAPADCDAGYYCPNHATTIKLVCPAGYFSPAGSGTCKASIGGYYTTQGTTEANKEANKCNQGFFCATGTDGVPGIIVTSGSNAAPGAIGPTQETCDTNYYTTSGSVTPNKAACTICTAGSYCLRGVADPVACPAGYYCPEAELYPIPCEKGSFRATTGAALISDCTACTAGKVCSQTGLTAPDKDCDAGFYCPEGSVFSRTTEPAVSGSTTTSANVLPTGKTRAIECPAGSYCPTGAGTATPCAAGTYNSVQGQRTVASCLKCPAGKYCEGTGNTAPDGDCDAGYFCPEGSSSKTQTPAPVGHYSLAGAADSTKCNPGTYQDTAGKNTCIDCTAGKYCPGFGNSAVTECPAGSYCPLKSYKPTPCPAGTFSPTKDLTQSSDCTPCTAGKYCEEPGLTAVTGTCDAGYFCKSNSISKQPSVDSAAATEADQKFGPCWTGYYCTAGITAPAACAAGTYMDAVMAKAATECKPCLPGKYCEGTANKAPDGDCDSGYYCTGGSATKTPATECVAGQYCPTGSSMATKCAAGTFSAANKASTCTPCTAGNYCVAGTSNPVTCPAGHYCPQGTKYAKQNPCLKGKFRTATGASAESDCVTCTAGKFCEFDGTSTPADCAAGYYCLAGSTFSIPEESTYGAMCAPGEFCPAGSATAQKCTGGSYCETYTLAAVTGQCDAGYYCTTDGSRFKIIPADFTSSRGAICPIGKYCVQGTTTPADCPVGTYSASTGLLAEADCYKCPAGYFCDTAGLSDYSSKVWPAGYFCPNQSTSGTANPCPKGYSCPAGSGEKIICGGGTYQDTVQQSTCKTCTTGNYCPFNIAAGLEAMVTCPKGYKCSEGGLTAPAPCLAGEYQDTTGQTACKACPAGSYCDRQGLEAVSGTCPAGFYCPANQVNFHEFMCKIGYYCTAGASTETVCPKGKYCDRSMFGTAGVAGLQGYYFDETTIKQPNPDGKTCPRGNYCPTGSIDPTKCAIGTYNNKLGSTAVSDCFTCPQGKICDEEAQVEPKDTCPATKYCLSGSVNKDCEKGFYCPAGLDYEIKCQPGSYQDETAKATCKDCPEGYYCDGDLSGNSYQPLKCPPGYYCPGKTGNFDRYPCPIGRIGAATSTAYGLKTVSECTTCPEKFYCDRRGLSASTAACKNGYLCSAGSVHPTGLNTQKCPQGNYCIAGTQTACNAGYYNAEVASSVATDCIICEHGKYCTNTISAKADWPAGKTCAEGLSVVTGAVDCIKGHYCPTGSFQGIKCATGQYQDLTGQTSCKTCTANHICNALGLESQTTCPDYRYCPAGSIRGRRCDPGQFIASTGTYECAACTAGSYCWPLPKASPDNGLQGTCSAGYICQGGSSYQKPLISLTTIVAGSSEFSTYNGPVYPGYKSTDGTTQTKCAVGKWQPSSFSQACVDCREGHYCPVQGLSDLSNYVCNAGYTCGTGETTANPTAKKCPVNTQCPGGSVFAQRCADGYKNPSSTGLESCLECGAGSYCYQTGTPGSYTENVVSCATAHTECTSEILKREIKCQQGYYLNAGTCTICTATNYCRGGAIAGKCIAGFICNIDTSSPISTPNPVNRQCPINQYCLEGVTAGVTCTAGTFNGESGGVSPQVCLPCEPGYTCKEDSSGNIQVTACPIGKWCPEYDTSAGTQEDPKDCPIYTSSSVEKLFLEEMCTYCPAGYDCAQTGIAEFSLHPCPKGYFCIPNALNDLTTAQTYKSKHDCPQGRYGAKTGLTVKKDCTICPAGYWCNPTTSNITPQRCVGGENCPEGSELAITCVGGKYCRTDNNFQQTQCPVNHKCVPATENPVACSAGVICAAGVAAGFKCAKGYEVQRINGVDTCISCPQGYYNDNASVACPKCPAGYLCYGPTTTDNSTPGTNTPTPTIKDTHRGEICPKGYYCPEGSYAPTACPVGKYNEFEGMKALDDCLVCPVNTYNDEEAATGCQPCGECNALYVFRKPSGEIERNNVSKLDCIPLVFPICDDNTQARNSAGECVPDGANSCATECPSGGTRDTETGKCTCSNTESTADEICNQACRDNASKVTVSTTGAISYTKPKDQGAATSTIDLSTDSNAIGSLTCTDTDGCKVNQLSMSDGTPQGTYGTVGTLSAKARRLLGEENIPIKIQPTSHYEFEPMYRRGLATVSADTATISNPVVCIEFGNSIMFEVKDYDHYPVYDENNILNSNSAFDYGPFVDLETQIIAKNYAGKTGATDPILFSYTFTVGGTYVFYDKTTTTNQLVIVVANSGEQCPSSAAIQTSTSRALTTSGVSQNDEIVLRLDYGMLFSIVGLMVIVIIFVGLSVAYCLHKAFDCKIPKVEGYRTYQKDHDLDFELLGSEETPEVVNQESCHYYPVEDEHDMENVNFGIHGEIIQHSKDFLNLYDDAMFFTNERKRMERELINELIREIDMMIKLIGDSAIHGKMYYGARKNIEMVMDDIERDQKNNASSDSRPNSAQSSNSEDGIKDELTKAVLKQEQQLRELLIKDKTKEQKEEKLKQEILEEKDFNDPEEIKGSADDEDLSLQEKIRRRIENDEDLDDHNKDKLLYDHEKKLDGIEDELEKERQRQEHELQQLLRAKAEARRKKNALEGNPDEDEEELDKIQKKFEDKIRDSHEDIDQQIFEAKKLLEKDKGNQELQDRIKDLNARKLKIAEDLEKERMKEAKRTMERLRQRNEMKENEIRDLIDKYIPHDSQEKLQMDQDFHNQVENINQQKAFELEQLKRQQEEEMYELQKKLDRQGDDGSIDTFINTLSQRVIDQYGADEEDKSKHLDRMDELRRVLKDNDNSLEKDMLIKSWQNGPQDMAGILKKNQDKNDANIQKRLDERRNEKKKRMMEALKIAHEEEEAKLILDQLGKEHFKKSEINRDQICKIVKMLMKKMEEEKDENDEIKDLTLQKIKQLFESMFSEVEMADLTNQLVKHFAEKEVMLKRLLARYVDIQRMEKANIKKHYAHKHRELEADQNNMDPEDFEEAQKDLIFEEENALRNMNLDKLHKEEEAALLQSLEKKHAKESIQLKNDLLEEKIKAYNDLFRNFNRKAHDEEIKIYKKALWSFKAKKEKELERRLRAIEFAKSKMINEFEREIQNKISDYEELLRRKAEEEKLFKDRKDQMREALLRHKQLIKDRMNAIGKEDKERLFNELDKNYKGLSLSIDKERKRMFVAMQEREQKRRELYGERNVNDFFQGLEDGGGYRNKVAFMDEHTYLGRQLNNWKKKVDNKFRIRSKMEEMAKLNYKFLKQPGSLMHELLRRVKNLEILLRGFDSEVITNIMRDVGDLQLQARQGRR